MCTGFGTNKYIRGFICRLARPLDDVILCPDHKPSRLVDGLRFSLAKHAKWKLISRETINQACGNSCLEFSHE